MQVEWIETAKRISMFKIKRRKIYAPLMFALMVSLVIAFSVTDSFAQKGGKGRYRHISLKKGVKKNGYTTLQRGANEIFVRVVGAEDPNTGKKLEGEKKLEYKCKLNDIPIVTSLLFSKGVSTPQKVECLILITPRVIVLED
jgi:hypothetical protein